MGLFKLVVGARRRFSASMRVSPSAVDGRRHDTRGWLGVRFTFRCRARRNDQDRLARVLENVVRNASQECTDACKTARSDHDEVDVEFARLADDCARHVAVVRHPHRCGVEARVRASSAPRSASFRACARSGHRRRRRHSRSPTSGRQTVRRALPPPTAAPIRRARWLRPQSRRAACPPWRSRRRRSSSRRIRSGSS